jgi:uncharacterized protein
LMRIDVNSFVGAYPFRRVPGTSPEALLQACDRVAIDQAWISHLPSVFWREPAAGNSWLYETAERYDRFRPVPAVHPGLPGWEDALAQASEHDAPAVRCDPMYYGVDPTGTELQALSGACATAGVPLLMAVRLEDGRQRHPNDRAGELPPWAVRALIRSSSGARLIVTHADRAFIEEVHFGSTPDEASRIWWDISWIWGPPEDHLATLIETVGVERFVFGTGQPLRIPETSQAKLDLLELSQVQRDAIESKNLQTIALTGMRR